MDWQINFGILNIDMAYWGIACTTALISTSFLAFEIKFSFHPSSFLFTLAKIHKNTSFFEAPQFEGISKYFPILSISRTRSSAAIFLLNDWGQHEQKEMPDLLRLISCPEARQYSFSIIAKFWHSFTFPSRKKIESSAKRRCDNVGQNLLSLIPLKSLLGLPFSSRT